ncbi:MAG TPA: hypothetical protein DEQ40_06150, partial [Oxalobacteraceae bacterium]|nr:hypothetical protein [Oxalobacteraceae bacterium]
MQFSTPGYGTSLERVGVCFGFCVCRAKVARAFPIQPTNHSPRIIVNRLLSTAGLLFALAAPAFVQAQVAVQANPDHAQLLASPDARLAANKRLVYDFWREV